MGALRFEPVPDPREHPWYGSTFNAGWRLLTAVTGVAVLWWCGLSMSLLVLVLLGVIR